MFSKHIRIAVVLILACCSSSFALDKPAQQGQTKSQTINSDTGKQEMRMQFKLQSLAESGKLDADAVSDYQQRLDELKANEEELRVQGGMNKKAVSDLQSKLDEMDHQLDKAAQDRAQERAKSAKKDSSYSSSDNPTDSSSYAKSGSGDSSQSSSYTKSTDN